jgi:hypothetical protein
MTGATGLEPATSAVTGQRSNQLSYAPSSCLEGGWRTPSAGGQYAKPGDPLT